MTEAEKIKYLNHLRYEVIMVRWAFDQIPTVPPSLLRNAFIECFAVHARCLYDFLTSNRDSKNVLANHYVSDFKPLNIDDASGKIQKLNRQIFHTGKLRTEDPTLKFNTEDGVAVLRWVEEALDKLVNELKKTPYPSDWLPPKPDLRVVVPTDLSPTSQPTVIASATTAISETYSVKSSTDK
jgi:hypothetical protein